MIKSLVEILVSMVTFESNIAMFIFIKHRVVYDWSKGRDFVGNALK